MPKVALQGFEKILADALASDQQLKTLEGTRHKLLALAIGNLVTVSSSSEPRQRVHITIKKTDGGWLVDIQPGRRGNKRIRKTLATKSEALQFEAWAKTQVVQNDGWVKPKKNLTKLSELIEL